MPTLEDIFIKEFKKSTSNSYVTKDIYKVPLPEQCKDWEVSGCDLFFVNGINEDKSGLFYGLNGELVKKLPKNTSAARRKIDLVSRDFVRDSNNRFIYEDVKIPSDSTVVVSSKNLNLPYGYTSIDKGFGYIDFVTSGKFREYIYYVPKTYIYKTSQTALALSVKDMKNFAGMGYVSWKFGLIYLHIVPYKPNMQYVGTKILKTSLSTDYNDDIRSLVDYWIRVGVIPNIGLCKVADGNLALKPTIRGYDYYEPIDEISLGDKVLYGMQEEE